MQKIIERVWNLHANLVPGEEYSKDMEIEMHQTIKKVSNDFENLKYNTAIAALMSLVNSFNKKGEINHGEYKTLLLLYNPVAPHVTEELWNFCGFEGYLSKQEWPKYLEEKTVRDEIEVPIQINGKVRLKVIASKDATQEEIRELIFTNEENAKLFEGKTIVKEIFVPGKIYNIVIK